MFSVSLEDFTALWKETRPVLELWVVISTVLYTRHGYSHLLSLDLSVYTHKIWALD